MPYNYRPLLGRMKERDVTQEVAAKAIGICSETLSAKLNNKAVFKQSEIIKLCTLLDIKCDEIGKYFFTH